MQTGDRQECAAAYEMPSQPPNAGNRSVPIFRHCDRSMMLVAMMHVGDVRVVVLQRWMLMRMRVGVARRVGWRRTATALVDLESDVSLAPVVANNMLYVLDDKGRISAFR